MFVTVGTTSFDELVEAATEASFLKVVSPLKETVTNS